MGREESGMQGWRQEELKDELLHHNELVPTCCRAASEQREARSEPTKPWLSCATCSRSTSACSFMFFVWMRRISRRPVGRYKKGRDGEKEEAVTQNHGHMYMNLLCILLFSDTFNHSVGEVQDNSDALSGGVQEDCLSHR